MSSISPITALAIPATAFAISALLILALVRAPGIFFRLLDEPNARSLHTGVIPRTGGLAVLFALACAGLLTWLAMPLAAEWAWMSLAGLLVAGISLLDDFGEVKPLYRLAVQLGAAIALVSGGFTWSTLEIPGGVLSMPPTLAIPLTILFVVWMTNLYNFMDGMDGLAGGMTAFGFGALALLGWQAGDVAYAVLSASVATASAAFLLGNFPPARIFLGDLGSATLGLLAASFALLGSRRGLFPIWAALIAFSPFILDATWTLLRRLLRGERVWQAHRSHHYQRLVLTGWSHRKTVLRAYLLMAACGACAVAIPALSVHEQWYLLAFWAVIYLLINYRIRLAERGGRVVEP